MQNVWREFKSDPQFFVAMALMSVTKPSVIALIGFGPPFFKKALEDSGDINYVDNSKSLSSLLTIISSFIGIFLGLGVGKLIDLPKSSRYHVKLYQAAIAILSLGIACFVVMIW